MNLQNETALIVGAGAGLSASVARKLKSGGARIALAARNTDKLSDLARALDAEVFAVDAGDAASVAKLFEDIDAKLGAPKFTLYNPSARARGPLIELDPAEVENALRVTAFGGFAVAQEAAKRLLARELTPEGRGAVFFTGASASIKGYPRSSSFAMGKFALRGLAQSMARELQPQGIHVAHFIIDGGIRSEARQDPADNPDSFLDPDAIAETYVSVLNQPRNAWTWEVELRPWVETF